MAAVSLQGKVRIPGDKSITHRAVMFGAVAHGVTEVRTSNLGRDNFATTRIMRQLGAEISGSVNRMLLPIAHEEGLTDFTDSGSEWCTIKITGKGFDGLREPKEALNCGNSGTTARLLTGLLAGRPFSSSLTGDASLSKRPFRRVVDPLSKMGASFSGDMLPFTLTGGKLRGIDYESPHASAQVKSAIILAGLQASGSVSVTEPRLSRDHTERMLTSMGCEVRSEKLHDGRWKISLPESSGRGTLRAQKIDVPGDISAAAFFLVAGSIFPNSSVEVLGVGFNETRLGVYNVLLRMGANLELVNERLIGGERVVDVRVKTADLQATEIGEEDVVLGIDEIPSLAVAAAVAHGKTRVTGAAELRVKESDRITMTANILRSFGVEVEESPEGMTVTGQPALRSRLFPALSSVPDWKKSGDHRIAMCGALMELLATGRFDLPDKAAVETSFPGFQETLQSLTVR